MARMARLVVPDHPHLVTQRGNRGQTVFFGDDDYRAYLDLLAHWAAKAGTAIWSYALMPDQVQLILVPAHEDGLRASLGEAHRRYTRRINDRQGCRGHLWQERFHSVALDDDPLLAAARYVALYPVAAGLVAHPEDWPWGSARAHLSGRDDGVAALAPLSVRVGDWAGFLAGGLDEAMRARLETHLQTGRPLGGDAWLTALEARLGRRVRALGPGRPRKDASHREK